MLGLMICFITPAFSQNGYNKIFTAPGAMNQVIIDALVDNDTIVCFGTVVDSAENKIGVYFARLDTLGNILLYKTHYDTFNNGFLVIGTSSKLIKAVDGGYVGTARYGQGQACLAIRFDPEGNILWTHQINKGVDKVIYDYGVFEDKGSFLFYGNHQDINYNVDIFCRKIDQFGNFIWHRNYHAFEDDESPRSFMKNNDNSYFLGAYRGKHNAGITDPGYWTQTWIVEIDSMGYVKKDFLTEKSEKQVGPTSMHMQNGELTYTSALMVYNLPGIYVPLMSISMHRINWATGERLWTKLHSERGYLSYWYDVRRMPGQDDWIAVGAHRIYPPGWVQRGYIGRISAEGDLLWSRTDSAVVVPDVGCEGYLVSVDFLSSGSIIAAGYSDVENEQKMWLLKISPDGCMTPINCALSATRLPSGKLAETSVSPNPVADVLTVELPEGEGGRYEVYNSSGRLVLLGELLPSANSTLNVSTLEGGVYFLHVYGRERAYVARFVKVP
jgi:hypothetical protein